ncbi:MAG: phosphoserine phosphatase SerB [Thiolinea sp.]
MIRLAVFDFDSTLMDGETIDFLAAAYGKAKEVSNITERTMQGELDFFESLQQRVSLLKGLSEAVANEVFAGLPYMPGAKDCITELKSRGITVICFSGGFRPATTLGRKALGFDADFANILHVRDGELSGLVGGDMMFSHSKGDMLERLQSLLGISEAETMAIGDGANDLSMFERAGTRIAFCAKPVLQDAATHCVNEKDLMRIPELI